MRNKIRMSLISGATMLCLLLSGCGQKEPTQPDPTTAPPETIAAIETVPASDLPTTTLAHEEEAGALLGWELDAAVWSSSNGASVTLTAQPREHVQGQSASFIVRLEGKDVENRSCDWNGTCYTATVDLEAADGYEYECVIFPPQGAGEHFALSYAYDSLVYMQSNLSSFCNLFVSDFKVESGNFVITAGYAQVQLPLLCPDGTSVDFESAVLSFELNGNQIESKTLELPSGESEGSYLANLSAISFEMPEMESDYQLDLYLKATLSNGEFLSANGGSWYFSDGQLQMTAG